MQSLLIYNATIVTPGESVRQGRLLVTEGRIAAIDPDERDLRPPYEHIDADGDLLTPGLVDIHTHGIHTALYERGEEDLQMGSEILPTYGTTCVLPTLYSVMSPDKLHVVEKLAKALSTDRCGVMPGFHMEGPFLVLAGAGGATIHGDVGLLDELLAAANGRVLAMSISPDTKNIVPVIERLRENDVAVFITHTRASVAQTADAIGAGARHATHFYDVFPVPVETEAGVRPVGAVETILADDRCSVDFICDGVHVEPMAIKAALRAKGWERLVAITDSNIGAGLPDGVYETSWGYSVRVRANDAARIATADHPLFGKLAGSSLTMNAAMANVLQWLPLKLAEAWAIGTRNPATVVGLLAKGRIEVGADADLVQWNTSQGDLRAVRTWVGGRCVHELCAQSA